MVVDVNQYLAIRRPRWHGALAAIVCCAAAFATGCANSPPARAPVVEAGERAAAKPASARAAKQAAKQAHRTHGTAAVLRGQAKDWRGVPYRYGGTSRRGVDCSAFVQITLRDKLGIDVPRTTREQIEVGRSVRAAELAPGDLVFFRMGLRGRHVGIYLGNREFVHVSERAGVVVSKLDSSYWQNAFWQARRPESNS